MILDPPRVPSPFGLTEDFMGREIEEHRLVLAAARPVILRSLGAVLGILEESVRAGGKLLLFGNGGSAADAQHLAAELVIRFKSDRPAIAALALTDNSAALTACGNDMGFAALFSRQIEALARRDDVAIAISTSGRSENVLAALREARHRGVRTVGLTGNDGGDMIGLCDAIIVVPSRVTARIQEMHGLIGHILCSALEQRLGLV